MGFFVANAQHRAKGSWAIYKVFVVLPKNNRSFEARNTFYCG